jgi:hypothetical protein
MNELTATPTHASVLYLRLGDFATKAVVEQARMRAQLEAVVATGLSVLPERDRIVLDTADGMALVVLDNALGALKAAERCLDAAAVLPLCVGAGHGAVAAVAGGEGAQGLLGDGLHSAAVAAGFAKPAQLLVTRAFREAVAQQEPVRQADLVRAGMFADASVRTHELFVMDRTARRRRRGRLVTGGAIAAAVLLVAGGIGRLAYRQEGPFAPKAEVLLSVAPDGEVFLDGEPQGRSPPLAQLRMRAGTHMVEIRRGDDPPLRRELTVKPGERVELRHVFTPLPVLVFDVSPGGDVFVDGVARGAIGTLKQLEVSEGRHRVEVRHGAFPPYQRDVTAKRGEQVAIRHVFAPAVLSFSVKPDGGEVFVNGKHRGRLPGLAKLELTPGRYAIEVRYAEYPALQRTVDLKTGQRLVIEHQFRPPTFIERLMPKRK